MTPFYTSVTVHGDKTVHRYVDADGTRKTEVADIDYAVYLPAANGPYTNLYGEQLIRKRFDGVKEFKEYIREYGKLTKVHGMDNPELYAINQLYPQRPVIFDFNLVRVANIDIETDVGNGFPDPDVAAQEINTITACFIGDDRTWTWTTLDYNAELDTDKRDNESIVLCGSERELLIRFLGWWDQQAPDAVTGYNIVGFDLPYLVNRIGSILDQEYKKLSPLNGIVYRPVTKKEHPVTGKDQIEIAGLAILDYVELYKKFNFSSPPDYKLETIAQQELGKGKVDYGEFTNIKDFYHGNPTKFVRYNIVDVLLVNELDAKLRYMLLAYTLQYYAKCNTQNIFGQVKFWDSYIFNLLSTQNIIVPAKKAVTDFDIEGAFVAEPRLGRSGWTITVDAASLYPLTMMQYNMGPDTIVDGSRRHAGLIESLIAQEHVPELEAAREQGLAFAANGATFTKHSDSIFRQVVAELFGKRVEARTKLKECEKEYQQHKTTELANQIASLDATQMAMKIAINSLYGASGNSGFRYYNPNIAEAITQSGQLLIRYIGTSVCKFLDERLGTDTGEERWIYSDTDSCFFDLQDFVDRITQGKEVPKDKIVDAIDRFVVKEIDPFIDECTSKLAQYMNALENKMSMKREVIADACLFRAKKNYIMQVLDNEGVRYAEPKLKMMGIETARSTTPQFVKDALIKCYRHMLNGTNRELLDEMQRFRVQYDSAHYDLISTPRGINNLGQYIAADGTYKAKTPFHVKAAGEHNRLVRELGLKDVMLLQDGDKVRLLLLTSKSPIEGNYIAYNGELPKEFDLEQYIDRPSLYQKTFEHPVESFTKLMGWRHQDVYDVSDFFS